MKKGFRSLLATASMVAIAGIASAAPWSGSGTYNVGPGGDYATLAAFINASTGYLHGEGNITVAAASTAVTAGTGATAFLSEVAAGDQILVGTQILTVASVTDNSNLVLSAPAAAATNATYVIKKTSAPPAAISGDVTVLITGDITETKNVPVMGDFQTFSLTIKPAPATTPRVSFTRAEDNSGLTGGFVIGGGIQSGNIVCSKADKVIIDGSNTVAGTTRDMTFYTDVTFAFSAPIVVNGDNDQVVVKNLIVNNNSPSTGGSTSGLRFNTANVTVDLSATDSNLAGLGFADPDNWIVDNCEVIVTGNPTGGQGHGIRNSVSGSPTGAAAQTGFQITNNDIAAVIRGVFLDGGAAGNITGNRLITPGRSGFDTYGIFVNNGRSATTPTVSNFSHNTISVANSSSGTATTGAWGVRVLSAGALGNEYNVDNNTIYANNTGAYNAGVAGALCGIQCTSGVTFRARHNSISLVAANLTPSANNANIAGYSGPTAVNGNVTLLNNTISSSVQNLVLIRNARDVAGQPFVSNYNNLYAGGSALTGLYLTTTYATLANWQAAAPLFDANSVAVDPSAFTGGESLHLISDPGASFQTTNVIGAPVANDIDGQARGVTPYYGADEFSANTAPTAISGTAVASVAENATGVVVSKVIGADADSFDYPVITATSTAGAVSVARATYNSFNISLSTAVDFETNTSFTVNTTATDRAGATTTQAFVINVTDVNEAPTAITPTPGTPTVAENAAAGTSVATLAATDPDAGETFVYTLVAGTGDTNNALFQIVGNDLQVLGALDFDTLGAALSVRVQVQDQGGTGLTFATAIPITLTNEVGEIDVTPLSKAFGQVAIGSTPTDTITITNTSTEEITVSALSITGADAAAYSLVTPPTLPVSVVNGTPLVLTVQFAPSAAVLYNDATLVITSNDADEGTVNVDLDGEGVSSVNEWNLLND